MALSGYFYGETANTMIVPKITWSAVQNVEENYSEITATLTYSRSNAGYTTGGYWSGSLSIGEEKGEVTGHYIKITQNSDTVAITYTAKVYHNDSGQLEVVISATGTITNPSNSTLSSTSISETVTLDTIPRASSIAGADAVTLGNACSVRWAPNSSTFRYKLTFSLGGWSYTTGTIHPNRTSTYSYTGYTLPVKVAEEITQDSQADMNVTLTTYSDSNCKVSVGSDSGTFTVTVPSTDETRPTVTMELTAETPISGLYLQGVSRVSAAISAEPKFGTEIESLSMTEGKRSYSAPFRSEPLDSVGSVNVFGIAVDSRGIIGYAKRTVTVLPYSRPRLTGVAAYRCTSGGSAADNGEYLRLEATRSYAPVNAGSVQKNFCKIRYRYKAEESSAYSNYVTVLGEREAGNTIITAPLLNGALSRYSSYTVQINAVDTVGQEATVTISIPSEQVFRHKRPGGKGLGLGGYCESDDLLDVHWNQRVRKNLQVDGKVCGTIIRVAQSMPAINTLTLRPASEYSGAEAVQSIFAFGSGWCQMWFLRGDGYVENSSGSVVGQATDGEDFVINLDAKRNTPIVLISADLFEIIE